MIGRLQGKLIHKKAPFLLVDVHGVGYELEAPMTTFYELPDIGAEVVLHTHLVVRDDAHLLFGFASETERRFFRSLIKVSGVGAKLALAILSGISADAFARCVNENDITTLVRLPGIGKKTAERLIIEMRDRLSDWGAWEPAYRTTTVQAGAVSASSEVNDAIGALVALGYKPQDAARMVKAVAVTDQGSEEIIRAALQAAVK
jgi:Holliday junction DNA helicase RuvA